MKFYKNKDYYYFIVNNNLAAIYSNTHNNIIMFFKKGEAHNTKNAAYIDNIIKAFYLNGNFYGNNTDFTKQSWRKFVKMQVFL
jgi:hypothetical protein